MIEKTKIYLSKSKAGDLARVAEIREFLQTLDIELLEFAGGTYNTDLLLTADYLLVDSPLKKEKHGDIGGYWIGKGQYEEIKAFEITGSTFIAQHFASDPYGKTNLVIDEVYKMEVVNIDWQKYYAFVECFDSPAFITDELDIEFKSAEPTEITHVDDLSELLTSLANDKSYVDTISSIPQAILETNCSSDWILKSSPIVNPWTGKTMNTALDYGTKVHENFFASFNGLIPPATSTVIRKKARLACIKIL